MSGKMAFEAITIPFDSTKKGFSAEVLNKFCLKVVV